MTTVYEAIMLAADHIERNSWTYNYYSSTVPCDGGIGCMWGHVGRALGFAFGTGITQVAIFCGVDTEHLYQYGAAKFGRSISNFEDPVTAAKILRAYANEFHAPKGSLRALTAVDESFVQLPAFITAQPKRDLSQYV